MSRILIWADSASDNVHHVAGALTKITVSLISGFLFLLITMLNFYLIHAEAVNNAYLLAVPGQYWKSLGLSTFACLLGMAGFIALFNMMHGNSVKGDVKKLYKQVLEDTDDRFEKVLLDTIGDYTRSNMIAAGICIPAGLAISWVIMQSSLSAVPLAIEIHELNWYYTELGEYVKSSYTPETNLRNQSIAITVSAAVTGIAQGFLAPKMRSEESFIRTAEKRLIYLMATEGVTDWTLSSSLENGKSKKSKADPASGSSASAKGDNDFLTIDSLMPTFVKHLGIVETEFKDFVHKRVGVNPDTGSGEMFSNITDPEVIKNDRDKTKGYSYSEALSKLEAALAGSADDTSSNNRGLKLVKFDTKLKTLNTDLNVGKKLSEELTAKVAKIQQDTEAATSDQDKAALLNLKITENGKLEDQNKKNEALSTDMVKVQANIETTARAIKDYLESINYNGTINS